MIKQSLMPKKRSFSDKILLIIKGFAMGTVNKIPGISGGIVALVSGFYLELIYSLKKINLISLKLILSGKWKAFYRYTNAEFLIFLFGGSIISFLRFFNTKLSKLLMVKFFWNGIGFNLFR